MSASGSLLLALIASLFFTNASFLRTLMLFEVVLLVASLTFVSSPHNLQLSSCDNLFSSLVVLTLAGTEAAVGLSLVVYVSL